RLPQRRRRHGHGVDPAHRRDRERSYAPPGRLWRCRRLRPRVRVARDTQQAGSVAQGSRDGDRGTGMSRILVVDNYDSFTYNLVQHLGALGADVTVWRNDAFALDEVDELAPDRIVVSP